MWKSISIVVDTHVKFGHPNVYERAEHDDKIKGIPGIAKIVLKCEYTFEIKTKVYNKFKHKSFLTFSLKISLICEQRKT